MAVPSIPNRNRSLDDLLTCSVCLDSFTEARTLSCVHSFCTECLKGIRLTFRREITCPLCKRLTALPQEGVEGLPIDYRIEQIRDAINHGFGKAPQEPAASSASMAVQVCDACKAQQGNVAGAIPPSAVAHCVECFMWYCDGCLTKHGNSSLFTSHSVFRSGEPAAGSSTVICPQHRLQAVKYVCKTCHTLLCTVCVMSHDSSHQMTAADHSAAEQCKRTLKAEFQVIGNSLNDINRRIKCLETIKEHHRDALYNVEVLIHRRASDIIEKVKEEEEMLIRDARGKFDVRLREQGVDSMTDLRFFSIHLKQLHHEINVAILQANAAKCLIEYDDLMSRIQKSKDERVPAVGGSDVRCKRTYRFVSSSSNIDRVIGSLQECNIEDDNAPSASSSSSTMDASTSGEGGVIVSPSDEGSGSLRKRTASILSALSPSRKDLKFRRVKGSSRRSSTSVLGLGSREERVSTTVNNIRRLLGDSATAEPGVSVSSPSNASSTVTIDRISSVDTAVAGTSNSVDPSRVLSSSATPSRSLSESVSPSRVLAISPNHPRALSDSLSPSRSLSDSASPSRVLSISPNPSRVLSDSANPSRSLSGFAMDLDQEMSSSPLPVTATVAPTSVVFAPINMSLHPYKRPSTTSENMNSASSSSVAAIRSDAETGSSAYTTGVHARRLVDTSVTYSNRRALLLQTLESLRSRAPGTVSRPTFSSMSLARLFDRPITHASQADDYSAALSYSFPASTFGAAAGRSRASDVPVERWRFAKPETTIVKGPEKLLTHATGVAIQANGNLVVAESESRVQIYNASSGWPCIQDVHPHSVTVSLNGNVACTDQRNSNVKTWFPRFPHETNCWGSGMFGKPSGIDFMSNGNLVVSDVQKKLVVVLSSPNEKVVCIGHGTPNTYEFSEPRHVAVDRNLNRILVSDVRNKCLMVFGATGLFIRKISLTDVSSRFNSPAMEQPEGLCVDQHSNILICDSLGHRLALFSPDGQLIEYLLTQSNGLQYPYDVAIDADFKAIAVVELYHNPAGNVHNAVKVFRQPFGL